MDYATFLAGKRFVCAPAGISEPPEVSGKLFSFQRDIVRWALRRGRAAVWADCGLGKGWMAIEWARIVAAHTGLPVLILAPLAVAQQFKREGEKFGSPVTVCREAADVRPGVNVANYERLHLFDASAFGGVVLDECFARGTPVVVFKDGRVAVRPIETIRAGDLIPNAAGLDVVANVHRREISYAIRITVRGQAITSSPNHPYFTQRGWVGASDLQAGDHIMETASGMRLVQDGLCPEVGGAQEREASDVLRAVLLSEMADAPAGELGPGPFARCGGETWSSAGGVVH